MEWPWAIMGCVAMIIAAIKFYNYFPPKKPRNAEEVERLKGLLAVEEISAKRTACAYEYAAIQNKELHETLIRVIEAKKVSK